MSMPRLTVLLALFLIVLGVATYLGTGRQSVTALIPTFLGLPLLACGLWARRESARKMAMHIAAVVALLGLGGTASGVVKSVKFLAGETLERPAAVMAQTAVALACLLYLVMAVRSFIQARRARGAGV